MSVDRVGVLHTGGEPTLLLLNMTCAERLSEGFTIVVDAFSATAQPLHTLLGTNISVGFKAGVAHIDRWFNGDLWEYTELDPDEHGFYYRLTLRPTTQFMTLNRHSKIFQELSVPDIANQVLIGSKEISLTEAYGTVDYCVQYQESDFDFVSRLFEYEGIYYYYKHTDGAHKMVLVDHRNSHVDLSPPQVTVLPRMERCDNAQIWSVAERRSVGPAKARVIDYDFKLPDKDLRVATAAPKLHGTAPERGDRTSGASGGQWSETSEMDDYPSKYTVAAAGTHYSGVWLDAHRNEMARSFAEGTLFAAQVGKLLKLKFGPVGEVSEYLIVGTTHRYTSPPYHSNEGEEEVLVVELELMPAAYQYRPSLKTPRPRIFGPQTAVVVGLAGEEIHTDEFGRIKVQFFWDREGMKDEKSSCWVRVVQSSAGQAWGSFTLPRIGQEVVVEFLDGDPDRPLVTGAVYNGNNGTPMPLPDNKTQFGLKTRITKGGGGYNHYWFEDKKGEEVVWFRAERDYMANIVNQNETRQYDKGNRKTTFMEGNDELIISKGKRDQTIQENDTKTIKNGSLTTIVETGDETRTIKTGKRTTTVQQDDALEVKVGNRSAKISTGNDTLKVSLGNVDIKVDLGSHKTQAMMAIELKVGGSSIKMDPMSITLEAPAIKIKGSLTVQIEGLMVESKASALSVLKGGIVMIN